MSGEPLKVVSRQRTGRSARRRRDGRIKCGRSANFRRCRIANQDERYTNTRESTDTHTQKESARGNNGFLSNPINQRCAPYPRQLRERRLGRSGTGMYESKKNSSQLFIFLIAISFSLSIGEAARVEILPTSPAPNYRKTGRARALLRAQYWTSSALLCSGLNECVRIGSRQKFIN